MPHLPCSDLAMPSMTNTFLVLSSTASFINSKLNMAVTSSAVQNFMCNAGCADLVIKPRQHSYGHSPRFCGRVGRSNGARSLPRNAHVCTQPETFLSVAVHPVWSVSLRDLRSDLCACSLRTLRLHFHSSFRLDPAMHLVLVFSSRALTVRSQPFLQALRASRCLRALVRNHEERCRALD